jgi:hypothetical protein
MDMRSFRVVTGLALVALAGAVALAPTAAPSSSVSAPAVAYAGSVAHASGGDAGSLPFPSIVNVRLVRAQAALDRATALVDENQTPAAAIELSSAVNNMNDAWDAATYVIETAPPPVAGSGAFGHVSGGAVGGLTFAGPEDTAFAVLMLQHTVATTAFGLVDTDPTQLPGVRTTVLAALRARDTAVDYIHSIPAPAATSGSLHAKTSGGAVGSTWSILMPGMVAVLNDEIQQLRGTRLIDTSLSPLVLQQMARWRLRIADQRDTINGFWPPAPAG